MDAWIPRVVPRREVLRTKSSHRRDRDADDRGGAVVPNPARGRGDPTTATPDSSAAGGRGRDSSIQLPDDARERAGEEQRRGRGGRE
jgi:hypothetical protein